MIEFYCTFPHCATETWFICENADFTKFSHSKIQLYKKGTILTDERALKNPSCNSLSFYNTIFKNSKIQNFRKLDLDGFFRVLTNIFWWGCEIWKQNIPKSLNSNAYVDFLQKYNDSKFAQRDNFGILLSPEKFSVKMNFKNYKYLSF